MLRRIQWLGHADARRVSESEEYFGLMMLQAVYDHRSKTLKELERLPASQRLAAHRRG